MKPASLFAGSAVAAVGWWPPAISSVPPFDPLAGTAALVVPDLLGLGRSLDESRGHFEPDGHLEALGDMLEQFTGHVWSDTSNGRSTASTTPLGGAITVLRALQHGWSVTAGNDQTGR